MGCSIQIKWWQTSPITKHCCCTKMIRLWIILGLSALMNVRIHANEWISALENKEVKNLDELRRLFLFNLDQYYRRRESINEEDPARTLGTGKQEGKDGKKVNLLPTKIPWRINRQILQMGKKSRPLRLGKKSRPLRL